MINLSAAFLNFVSLSYIDTTLALDLKQFQMSPLQIGAIFMVPAICRILTVQIWRLPLVKRSPSSGILVLGLLLGALCALLSGPMSVVPIPNSVAIVLTRQVVLGLAIDVTMQATLLDGIQETGNYGLPQNTVTNTLFSALHNSAACLG